MSYFPDTAAGVAVTSLSDAGALALSDRDVINRGGIDYSASMSSRATLFRKTPAGSRTAALPVTLTATDHDKNVVLTGTTGALVVDGTVTDGFRCHVINTASGVATYSGITGLMGTTSLASGAATSVMMAAATVYASASAGASAPATSYTMSASASSGVPGVAVTLTFAPVSGTWPSGLTIIPAQSGVTGTFSSTALSAAGGQSVPLTCTFTPGGVGTATFSASNNGSLSNPSNLTYSVSAAATAYTTSLSASSGNTNAPITITFTPTGGGWPGSEVITPTVSGVTGTFSPGTVAPAAGATSPVTCTFTPTAAGTASLSSTTSPSLTNTTGTLTFTAIAAIATAYVTSLSAASGAIGAAVTVTFSPTGGSWPAGQTITPTATALAGTFAPATLSPSGTAAIVCSFTPSVAATGSINSTSSPTLTNTSGAQTFTATTGAPSYPTVTTAGVTRLAIFDGNAGVTVTSGSVSAWADQSGNGNNLAVATAGSATLGGAVNGYPGIRFSSQSYSSNSGAAATAGASWIGAIQNSNTIAVAFKTGATVAAANSQHIFTFAPSLYTGTDDYILYISSSGLLAIAHRRTGASATYQNITATTLAPNTVYKVVLRYTAGSPSLDVWLNGTKTSYTVPTQSAYGATTYAQLVLGQAPSGYGDNGLIQTELLEWHGLSGDLSDTDCGSYVSYFTSKWGS